MESQQQPEYVDTSSPAVIEASQPVSLTKLPPAAPEEQWQRIATQISVFLAQLPDYLGRFFNENKQPIISFALIVAALIALRVVLTVLITLNDIPLLAPTFELIGIGYSVWFVSRYLLKTSNRQELTGELQKLKQQVVGSQQLPES
jgi:hypothetical protein